MIIESALESARAKHLSIGGILDANFPSRQTHLDYIVDSEQKVVRQVLSVAYDVSEADEFAQGNVPLVLFLIDVFPIKD